jgi:hypothetical protein
MSLSFNTADMGARASSLQRMPPSQKHESAAKADRAAQHPMLFTSDIVSAFCPAGDSRSDVSRAPHALAAARARGVHTSSRVGTGGGVGGVGGGVVVEQVLPAEASVTTDGKPHCAKTAVPTVRTVGCRAHRYPTQAWVLTSAMYAQQPADCDAPAEKSVEQP